MFPSPISPALVRRCVLAAAVVVATFALLQRPPADALPSYAWPAAGPTLQADSRPAGAE